MADSVAPVLSTIPATFSFGSDKIKDSNNADYSPMHLDISIIPIRSLLIPTLRRLATISRRFFCLLALVIGTNTLATATYADGINQRFGTNDAFYSFEVGLGQTADIPACSNCPPPRTSHRFLSILTSYERNLTKLTAGQSPWHGALFWRIEGGVSVITDDPDANKTQHLINFSPLMVQYRLFAPDRAWNPKFLGGVGFALTNWRDFGGQPLSSEHQFLVHLGAGVEFSGADRTYSIDYRLLHVSNGGSDDPNIGINAHVFSIAIPF